MSDTQKKKQRNLLIVLGVLTLTSIVYNGLRFSGKNKKSQIVSNQGFVKKQMQKEAKGAKNNNLNGALTENSNKVGTSEQGLLSSIKRVEIEEKVYNTIFKDENFEGSIISTVTKNKLERILIKSEYMKDIILSNEEIIDPSKKSYWLKSFESMINLNLKIPEEQTISHSGKATAKVNTTYSDTLTRTAADLHYKIDLDFKNKKVNLLLRLVKGEGLEETQLSYKDKNNPQFQYSFTASDLSLE